MRILAVDHGTVRAGCAICDPTETIVRPLAVVSPPRPRAVAALVGEQEAELAVVGVPVSLDGREGKQAALARAFAESLAGELDGIPVDTYDERLTTRLAEGSRRDGAGAPADALAAAHLLEGYLARRRATVPADGEPGAR